MFSSRDLKLLCKVSLNLCLNGLSMIQLNWLENGISLLTISNNLRSSERKEFREEIAENDGISDVSKKLMIATYIVSLNCVINGTTNRSEHFKNVASKFS